MVKYYLLVLLAVICTTSFGQTNVNSLAELRTAIQNSDQEIILAAGDYNISALPDGERNFPCTGSNNTITLTDVYLEVPVSSTNDNIFEIDGDNVTIIGGHIENTYYNGMTEVVDFEAYNEDRDRLANGAGVHIRINEEADGTTVIGTKMTVRGSFPYGYGSAFGIGGNNTYGLSKRSALSIDGPNAYVDGVEVQMRAFGHGIFLGGAATNSVIKNTLVEGTVRPTNDILAEGSGSLPARNGFKDYEGNDIQPNEMYSLSEDGIRAYPLSGTITVENCVVKKMRGGIRLYLGGEAIVKNCTSIDCEYTNYNLSANSIVENSYGNFTYGPIDDNRTAKSRVTAEWTLIPSPNAVGGHNIADLQGNNHDFVFHRTPGPLDSDETRAILVTGSNSTIVNETEYTIILESGTSGNNVTSCGPVINNGANSNTITANTNCDFNLNPLGCNNRASLIQAECFDEMLSINDEGESIGSIRDGAWAKYEGIDLTGLNSVEVIASSNGIGGTVEFRLDALDGELIGSVDVAVTGGWGNWQTFSTNVSRVTGTHAIYTVFNGVTGWLYNIDQFSFSEDVVCDVTPSHIEAECFDDMLGIQTENCSEGTLNVGYIQNGDWLKYDAVDLTGMNSIKARVSSKTTGSIIEVRLGSETGTLIGELEVSNTGGNQTWVTDSTNISQTTGVHDVYLVFTGGNGYLFNINHFGFSEDQELITGTANSFVKEITIYPNPTSNILTISTRFSSESSVEIFNTLGELVLTQNGITNETTLDLSEVSKGLYLVKITNDNEVFTKEILKL